MLFNYVLALCRRQILVDLNTRRLVNKAGSVGNRLVEIVVKSHIGTITAMYMRRIDNTDTFVSAEFQRCRKLRNHRSSLRRLSLGPFRHEVILHIDDDHHRFARINLIHSISHKTLLLLMTLSQLRFERLNRQ